MSKYGHYKFTVMSFKLRNAPTAFMDIIKRLFHSNLEVVTKWPTLKNPSEVRGFIRMVGYYIYKYMYVRFVPRFHKERVGSSDEIQTLQLYSRLFPHSSPLCSEISIQYKIKCMIHY